MELEKVIVQAKAIYDGTDTFELAEKDKLSIRKKNGGWSDILDTQVPNNKKWKVRIRVEIEETDT